MENVKDWCISRQLWWGHRIPAWFYADGPNDYVVAATREEALELAATLRSEALAEQLQALARPLADRVLGRAIELDHEAREAAEKAAS